MRQGQKQKVISYITQVANNLLHQGKKPQLDILLLQYGSAFFEADTDQSDFDLLMVVKYKSIEPLFGDDDCFEIDPIRKEFFFGMFAEKLKLKEDLLVFSAENARNP